MTAAEMVSETLRVYDVELGDIKISLNAYNVSYIEKATIVYTLEAACPRSCTFRLEDDKLLIDGEEFDPTLENVEYSLEELDAYAKVHRVNVLPSEIDKDYVEEDFSVTGFRKEGNRVYIFVERKMEFSI